ncbi:MAG TPA: hypothetical protein VHJ20_16115 [Polyangia bacterium]|nr:hypothetical protein [Polyangia bacterium]
MSPAAPSSALETSPGVLVWWIALSVVSVANIVMWARAARPHAGDALETPEARRIRRLMTFLSAMFTFGCAYRSFLPRAEGQRIVLVDTWISSVILSRLVATVAELSIVGQWAAFVGHWTKATRAPWGYLISRLLVPMIAFAEICSWYTTLTRDFHGSVIEESTWAITSSLMTLTLIALWWRRREVRKAFVFASILFNTAYVMFMVNVDVPMYRARVRADEAVHKPYVSVVEGFLDSARTRVLTRRWVDWKDEMPWMSLYFSAGVWISIALIRSPRFEVERNA